MVKLADHTLLQTLGLVIATMGNTHKVKGSKITMTSSNKATTIDRGTAEVVVSIKASDINGRDLEGENPAAQSTSGASLMNMMKQTSTASFLPSLAWYMYAL